MSNTMTEADTDKKVVILLPSYNPDEKLVKCVNDLKEARFNDIIVVDDCSRQSAHGAPRC